MKDKLFTEKEFRKELLKRMPGYKWTIHRHDNDDYLEATGTQSNGFNRISTLSVIRRNAQGEIEYLVKSSGYGKNSPWLEECKDLTLASALRALQNYYEAVASNYSSHAHALRVGRLNPQQD